MHRKKGHLLTPSPASSPPEMIGSSMTPRGKEGGKKGCKDIGICQGSRVLMVNLRVFPKELTEIVIVFSDNGTDLYGD